MTRPLADHVFNALLCAVPQGLIFGIILISYNVWMALTMRRFPAATRIGPKR
jgi:hypothetical protein